MNFLFGGYGRAKDKEMGQGRRRKSVSPSSLLLVWWLANFVNQTTFCDMCA